MTDAVRARCELLVRNQTAVRKKFFLENELMCLISGMIFTLAGEEADIEKMKACRKILKKNTRALSHFRAVVELVLLSKMTLASNPEQYLNDVLGVYDKIIKGAVIENPYMALAAILICDIGRKDDSDEIVSRLNELTKRMNSEHPIITAADDTSFIAFLALTDKSVDSIVSDLEEGYTYLKKTCGFRAGNDAIYELCEVLALSYGNMEDKCDKVMRLFNTFADREADYGKSSELSSLGSLIDADTDPDTLVNEIIDAEEYLKSMKVFPSKDMDRKKRFMYSAPIVAGVYSRSTDSINNSVVSNTVSIIRASQVAKMISIISSVAPNVLAAVIPDPSEEEKKEK